MNNKKVFIALALIVLLGVVGGTYAYFTSTATLTNEFTTGTYETKIVETFESPDNWTPGTTTDKKVNVVNKGTVDVAVRAKIEEKWTSANGNELPLERDGVDIATYSVGSDWVLATDGYYYYKNVLSSGETSSDFMSSVTFNPSFTLKEGEDIECTTTSTETGTTVDCVNLTTGYAGAKYRMNITIETIQADRKWNYVSVNNLFYWGYGSTPLDEVDNVTIQIGEEETITTNFVKIGDNVYKPEEMNGLKATKIYNTGEIKEEFVYSYNDILYENDYYFYFSTKFSEQFIVVMKEFDDLTPGVWVVSENNPTWNNLQYVSSYDYMYIVAQ